uniref:Uncharacterized protein n=1 Tax=Anguilla anguilla TaxID=7936 RepID=A0A0E9QMH4_ANGAN
MMAKWSNVAVTESVVRIEQNTFMREFTETEAE